jgi:hypothetical protein
LDYINAMDEKARTAVVEMPDFIASTRKMLDYDEREELVDFLAMDPTVGDVIAGTGGVRKLRWALPGRGKSGGARVIYYYHDEHMPLFLLDAYAKSEMANISHADRNNFKRLVGILKAQYGR